MSGTHPLLACRVDVHYETGALIVEADLKGIVETAVLHAPPEAVAKAIEDAHRGWSARPAIGSRHAVVAPVSHSVAVR